MQLKTTLSILAIIAAIVGIIVLLSWKKPETSAPTDQSPIATDGSPKFLISQEPTMVSVAEDSYLLGVGGSYPQFAQADAAFNAKIAKMFTDEITNFKKTANDDYQARLEMGGDEFIKEFQQGSSPYSFGIKTNVIQSNDDYISAVVHYGGYVGGAHGYQNIVTFNYDVRTKKELAITDFMTLADASAKSRAQLQEKLGDAGTLDASMKSMMYAGTDPKKPENFANFTFIKGALSEITIYFSEYQVAPYVMGEQTVVFQQ